jgi:hypothetical protein
VSEDQKNQVQSTQVSAGDKAAIARQVEATKAVVDEFLGQSPEVLREMKRIVEGKQGEQK